MKKSSKKKPTWNDLKRQLAEFDRPALLGLIQDLYAASKDNQTFLHARFALGEDVLEPYKTTIDRWVCPDVIHNQHISIAKAKRAISDYKKAIGHPEGMAELSVFYCESCATFLGSCCVDYEELSLPKTPSIKSSAPLDHRKVAHECWSIFKDKYDYLR